MVTEDGRQRSVNFRRARIEYQGSQEHERQDRVSSKARQKQSLGGNKWQQGNQGTKKFLVPPLRKARRRGKIRLSPVPKLKRFRQKIRRSVWRTSSTRAISLPAHRILWLIC